MMTVLWFRQEAWPSRCRQPRFVRLTIQQKILGCIQTAPHRPPGFRRCQRPRFIHAIRGMIGKPQAVPAIT